MSRDKKHFPTTDYMVTDKGNVMIDRKARKLVFEFDDPAFPEQRTFDLITFMFDHSRELQERHLRLVVGNENRKDLLANAGLDPDPESPGLFTQRHFWLITLPLSVLAWLAVFAATFAVLDIWMAGPS